MMLDIFTHQLNIGKYIIFFLKTIRVSAPFLKISGMLFMTSVETAIATAFGKRGEGFPHLTVVMIVVKMLYLVPLVMVT